MCGLVGVFSKKNKSAGQYAFELYKKQDTRGKRGFGYIAIHDGKIVNIQRAKTEETIRERLMKEKATTILFHHRMPTSTENSVGTAHPMFVSHPELENDYYLAHNGIINNQVSMQTEHAKLGYEYTTEHRVYEVAEFRDKSKTEMLSTPTIKFNDSEVLAIEFARYMEGLTPRIKAMGAAAFWAVAVEKGTNNVVNVFFGKNYGRDLCTLNTKKWFVVSSETGKDIEPMFLNTIDINTLAIQVSRLDIDDSKPITQSTTGFRTQPMLPSRCRLVLENKRYTSQEVRESGHEFTEFNSEWIGGMVTYRPKRFSGIPLGTTVVIKEDRELNWKEDEEEKKKVDPKVLKRLEELATEYAVAKVRGDMLEEALQDGSIDYDTYKKSAYRFEADASIAEDLMSALGVEDSLMLEVINTALEMEAFNQQYFKEDVIRM